MAKQRARVILDILVEHFEELDYLWTQRRAALRSPQHSLTELLELEERIEAHVRGLLVGGEETVALLQEGFAGEDPHLVSLAAYVLLRQGTEASLERVVDAVLTAEGDRLRGLSQALCHASIIPVRPTLQQALTSTNPALAATALEVLASHSLINFTTAQFEPFLKHDNPAIRRSGWRAVSMSVPVLPAVFEAGYRDADLAVREEALLAGAWGRQPALLEHCRKLAAKPTPEHLTALLLLAILGKPEDLARMRVVGQSAELGPQRFRILSAFGNPAVVDLLLHGMDSKDPRTAVAAGAAYLRITGGDVNSDQRTQLPPEDGSEPDEFEKEFLDEATLPSPEKARAHWQSVQASFQRGTRWCRGVDVTEDGFPALWDRLDMEGRWEAYLRGKYRGVWKGNPADLDRFPQAAAVAPPHA